MKVLSFDVGIKNLAYCVLSGSPTRYSIQAWDVVNLTAPHKCTACAQPAQYTHEEAAYCAKHLEKAGGRMRPKGVAATALRKLTKPQLLKTMHDYGMDEVDAKSRKTILHELFDSYLSQRYAEPITAARASSMPLEVITYALNTALKGTTDFDGVDVVVIERQMKSKMTAVGAMLGYHFTDRGVTVKFLSARHKLTVGGTPYEKRTYKQRKTDGIAMCKDRIPATWQAKLAKSNKKDDLSDAFLQGLWYLENNS
jgi:hypothetical protein